MRVKTTFTFMLRAGNYVTGVRTDDVPEKNDIAWRVCGNVYKAVEQNKPIIFNGDDAELFIPNAADVCAIHYYTEVLANAPTSDSRQ